MGTETEFPHSFKRRKANDPLNSLGEEKGLLRRDGHKSPFSSRFQLTGFYSPIFSSCSFFYIRLQKCPSCAPVLECWPFREGGGAGIVPKITIFVSCHCAKNVCCHSAKSILVFKLSVCQKYFPLVSLPKQILNLVILPKTVVGNLPKRCENKPAMLCK